MGLDEGLRVTRDWFVKLARMKLRKRLLAGVTAAALVRLALELRAERERRRTVDRQLGDLVRGNALDQVDADQRAPFSEPEIAIVIAALDEEDAIAAVLEALPTELYGHRVTPIVVVDGGTDDTAGVVASAGHVAVRHEINRGQGDALRTGFALALERKAAIVMTMDADGQHRPEELPQLLEPILADEADYVQGSRYLGPVRRCRRRARPRHPRLHAADQPRERREHHRLHERFPRDPRRRAGTAAARGAPVLGCRADHGVGASEPAHP